ncbi:molybdopterin molybdenumtransferase MoeA [Niabella ginsenosidivorans]|uniref:Molybdopterin molybdenumtransferase n=1 Tax=Niabella ginsenosidivorans TaxID=1176587 RepID=A0A1A9HZL6_9BACT|nr:molybdopterin molybdotransferase MoeA [Niabella ginsenosidivorans]ANH80525.1 molybdopterin molybdenumtransferase MoeA [Niabella ginsenosidivorans]
MITVEQAEKTIQSQLRHFGVEEVFYETALGRVLAEHLYADRDLPPFNRSTVDGIAIKFSTYNDGLRSFKIKATQAAGENPVTITAKDDCIEIMTGAALDDSADTVIRYEDIDIADGIATIKNIEIKKGQNIHLRGKDKKQGDVVANAGRIITPPLTGLAAAVGKTKLWVKKLPRTVIITTGDELVNAEETPTPYQLRRSNGTVIKSVLEKYKINAQLQHWKDDAELISNQLARCLSNYDVLLMSGGVSMGKFDHVPQVLEELGVEKLFHKVQQRPGKPFWFGTQGNRTLVFAFPGNPVSVFMCLHRYFIPWLENTLGIQSQLQGYAVLQKDIYFPYPLQYFAQVKLDTSHQGLWQATPVDTNGSGDFSNLIYTDAFIELPLEKNEFKKGEVYKVWRYQPA